MGKIFRNFALFFVFGPLSAMFSEPFFQALYDYLGWDTENLAGPFFNFVASMSDLTYFWHVQIAMLSLGVGIWLHYLANSFDRRKRNTNRFQLLSSDVYRARRSMDHFVEFPQSHYGRVRVKDPIAPVDDTARIRSLMATLKKFGVATPKIGPEIYVHDAELVSNYLATISAFVSNDQKKACNTVAKEFLSNSGESHSRLSRLSTLAKRLLRTPPD